MTNPANWENRIEEWESTLSEWGVAHGLTVEERDFLAGMFRTQTEKAKEGEGKESR